MTRTDDELLSGYIDGELSPSETERLTERLAAEPSLAARLERMRSIDESTRKVYAALDDTPMPKAVLDLLDEHTEKPAEDGNVVPLKSRRPVFLSAPVAIAASAALVAGIFAGEVLRGPAVDSVPDIYVGAVDQASDFHAFLENTRGGTERALGDGAGRILLTFEASDGRYCRQFDVQRAARSAQGLACREADGWHLQAMAYVPASPAGYQQASAPVSPAVAAAVSAHLGDGEPLDLAQENEVISGGWKTTPE